MHPAANDARRLCSRRPPAPRAAARSLGDGASSCRAGRGTQGSGLKWPPGSITEATPRPGCPRTSRASLAASHFSFRPEMTMMSHLRGEPGSASLPSPVSSPFSWTAGSRLWARDREKGPFAQAMPVGSTSSPEHEATCLEGRGEMGSVQQGGLSGIREGRDKAAPASRAKKPASAQKGHETGRGGSWQGPPGPLQGPDVRQNKHQHSAPGLRQSPGVRSPNKHMTSTRQDGPRDPGLNSGGRGGLGRKLLQLAKLERQLRIYHKVGSANCEERATVLSTDASEHPRSKRPDGQGASLEITLERLRKRGWEGESRLGVRVTSTQARASRTSVRHFF